MQRMIEEELARFRCVLATLKFQEREQEIIFTSLFQNSTLQDTATNNQNITTPIKSF